MKNQTSDQQEHQKTAYDLYLQSGRDISKTLNFINFDVERKEERMRESELFSLIKNYLIEIRPEELREFNKRLRHENQKLLAGKKGFESYGDYQNHLLKERGFKNRGDYLNHLAKKRGFENRGDYLNHLAKERGFESYGDYQNHLAKERGFENHGDYQNHLAKERGFENHGDYLNHLAKERGFKNRGNYQNHLTKKRGFKNHGDYLKQKALKNFDPDMQNALKYLLSQMGRSLLEKKLEKSKTTLYHYLNGIFKPKENVILKLLTETTGKEIKTLDDIEKQLEDIVKETD